MKNCEQFIQNYHSDEKIGKNSKELFDRCIKPSHIYIPLCIKPKYSKIAKINF